ncbi:MAG: DsrE family protein [Dissulfurispiraceae bacterium]
MGNIVMILRRSPYGDISAAEAVRHAMGGAADDLDVHLVLVDSGVLLSRKGQIETGTGFTNLEDALRDCVEMGAIVYADELSMKANYLEPSDVIEGVKIVSGSKITELITEAKTTMIF